MSTLKPEVYAQQQEIAIQLYNPEVVEFERPEEVDNFAAKKLIQQVKAKPGSILTLPSGKTPIGMYHRIVETYRQGEVNLGRVTIFNLDEYYPIDANHPSSYALFMRRNLIDYVPVGEWNIPTGHAPNLEVEVQRYQKLMELHQPVDLAVLGIGPGATCHIGFNEKGSSIDSNVRYVSLDQETITVNARLFDDLEEMPTGAITQGISDILKAKQILLIAKGISKAWGIHRTLRGPVSSDAPASFLRLHPQVTFILDKEAGQFL